MRIDARGWATENRKLDVATAFEGFQVWKDRAMMFLSRERPDVRRLLTWAEAQTKESLEADLPAQAAHLGIADLASVEYAVHDGIKLIILDSLLGRARNCVERGCELWRSLTAEWSGAAPQLKQARARNYQDPTKCKDTAELWSRLPAWERLGEEVKLAGLDLPEWMRNSAFEKLLPAQLLNTLISRPELDTYSQRLVWVKTQMEHARGTAQATAFGPGSGKDASGDVYMNSVEASSSEHAEVLAWALAEAVQQGDWAQTDALQSALLALKGSKGGFRKGLGKGKPGKGGAKGDKGGGAGAEFNGACNHCGIWGHRRQDCRRLDAELKKGGAKGAKGGGKGGKGGPKGGKGPLGDPLMQCAEEAAEGDDWADELAGAYSQPELDEWGFDNAICSVSAAAWPTPAAVETQKPGKVTLPWMRMPKAPTQNEAKKTGKMTLPGMHPIKTQNSFASLSLLTDDAEVLIGAVSGEMRGGRVVEAVVDSGAVHSVTPPGVFPGRVDPSPWSRAGRGYRAANGTGIKNLGQLTVPFATAEGHKCWIPFQVAEVEQPLLSVAHLTQAGNRVELGHANGRVVNTTTGRAIALERRGGVYIMKMYIADKGATSTPPFHRQGA